MSGAGRGGRLSVSGCLRPPGRRSPAGGPGALSAQAREECDQSRPLLRCEPQLTNPRIEAGVVSSPPVVEVDDVLEGGEASVVHVGRGASDLAERGRLEAASVLVPPRHSTTSGIGGRARPADAGVVEALVRQVVPRVAGAAAAPALEHTEPQPLPGLESRGVAGPVAVVGRAAREPRADVGRERVRDRRGIRTSAEDPKEPLHQPCVRTQPSHDRGQVGSHLPGIDDGPYHLLLERGGASVPREGPPEGAIEDRGSVPLTRPPVNADGPGAAVGEGPLGAVAVGTGEALVG